MNRGALNVYHRCTPVVDAEYDSESDRTPTEVVVEALAEAAGIDPLDLPPLYEIVDLESLNQLFGAHGGVAGSNTLLSFQFETWNVFIRSDGRIRVCDSTRLTDPKPVFTSSID